MEPGYAAVEGGFAPTIKLNGRRYIAPERKTRSPLAARLVAGGYKNALEGAPDNWIRRVLERDGFEPLPEGVEPVEAA
jgi:hypothetical protein